MSTITTDISSAGYPMFKDDDVIRFGYKNQIRTLEAERKIEEKLFYQEDKTRDKIEHLSHKIDHKFCSLEEKLDYLDKERLKDKIEVLREALEDQKAKYRQDEIMDKLASISKGAGFPKG